MACKMSIVLPALSAPPTPAFESVAPYSAAVRRPIEPVGRYFLAHATRTLRGHTWSEFEKLEAQRNVKQIEEDADADLGDEEQLAELLAHDPREWKTADLYAVLGLSHLRWRATEDQIRRAHRKQVLKHHPDKKSAAGGLDQDGFFKIIQKALEVMTDPAKRRQFDSVDEHAVVEPPAPKTEYDFLEAWTPVFDSMAHFSKKQPVPSLGGKDDTKAQIDAFYKFWMSFDSWKTFEFKDEDVPDDTANRDHKRHIERKNISNRKKLKQEDNRRTIELVQRAQKEDVRLKAFKDAAKREKERKEWERGAAARQKAEAAAAKKKAQEEASKKKQAKAKAPAKNVSPEEKQRRKQNKRLIRATPEEQLYFGGDAKLVDADLELLFDHATDEQQALLAAKLQETPHKEAYVALFAELVAEGAVDKADIKYFV